VTYVRILHPQLLPLPTSFPNIFTWHPKPTNLSTFSALSSNPTTIASRLKGTVEDSRKLSSTEDRDDLVNSIGEILNYFEEDDDWK
jgi:hypothetical protein